MTTRVIPASIDATGKTEVGVQLNAFLATAKPGDIVQAPNEPTYLSDVPLEIPHTNVKFMWEGATFVQTNARPFGAVRTDVTISAGNKLSTGQMLPPTCNWGYVSGPGIANGTEIVLDPTRKSGTLSNVCTNATGLSVTFTSKQDRGRCGFDITGTDLELHDATWVGPNAKSSYVSNLEAQHGVNLSGATNVLLDGISSNHMYGDGIYYGARGTKITTFVTATGGTINYNGRSGVSPMSCQDCSVTKYVIDHVGRTVVDFEPPDAGQVMDRFSLNNSIIGKHQLTLLSSGGSPDAHVGAIDFSNNCIQSAPMILWLVVGNATHQRGPYTINGNHSVYNQPFGGSYPTAALICIENALGATVTGNTGIVLQTRFPVMAVVRSRFNKTTPVVSGNQFTGVGCIESGPWV